jgi:hypothetical protein
VITGKAGGAVFKNHLALFTIDKPTDFSLGLGLIQMDDRAFHKAIATPIAGPIIEEIF